MPTGQQQPVISGTTPQGEIVQQQTTRRRWLPGLVIAGAVSVAALTGCASTVTGSAEVAPAAVGTDGGGQKAPNTVGTGGDKTNGDKTGGEGTKGGDTGGGGLTVPEPGDEQTAGGGLTVPTIPAPGGGDSGGGDTGGGADDGTDDGDTGGVIPAPDIPTMKTIDPGDSGLGPVTLEPAPGGGSDETTAAETTEAGGGLGPAPALPTPAQGGQAVPGGKCAGLLEIANGLSDLMLEKMTSGQVSQADVDKIFTQERMDGLPAELKPNVEKLKQQTEALIGKSLVQAPTETSTVTSVLQELSGNLGTACR